MNRQRFQLCLKEGRSGCRIWAPRAIVLQRLSRQRVQLSFKEGRSGCATVQRNRKDAYGGDRNLKKYREGLINFMKSHEMEKFSLEIIFPKNIRIASVEFDPSLDFNSCSLYDL